MPRISASSLICAVFVNLLFSILRFFMQVVDNLHQIRGAEKGTAVALGNFDGIHLGHRQIFRTLTRRAQELGVKSLVYTFEPHPLKVLAPERAPLLLNTMEEKERLIASLQVDILARIPFTPELACYPAEDFVREVLVDKLKIKALVIGYDFAFGYQRRGTGKFLQEQGRYFDFSVDVLQPLGVDGLPYSSTRVRELLTHGAVELVPAQLGRHYTLSGKVVAGDRRGRELGFPTANICTEKELLPAPGVYAVLARWNDREYQAVVNIGCRPTFGPGYPQIEAHLMDFYQDLYGQELRLYFFQRLRSEERFTDVKDLIAAIRRDIELARLSLRDARIISYQDFMPQDQSP
jgi:riboflavin kinase/FMN adenylyltransferase